MGLIGEVYLKEKFQVFTSSKYVNIMLDSIGYKGDTILNKSFLENSCGPGNILKEAVERYIITAESANISKETIIKDLSTNFVGFELDERLISECEDNLNQIIYKYGYENVSWNLRNEDYLKTNIEIEFDFIVGNPPYLMYQNISLDERNFIREKFLSCYKGKFDYCYPFIEKSMSELKSDSGKMSYLIPTSIFKNVYAEELRNLLKESLFEILDFKTIKVFDDATVSSSIVNLSKKKIFPHVTYVDVNKKKEISINKSDLRDKWIFSINNDISVNTGRRFGDFFKVSNSVATLLNKAFIIDEFEKIDNNHIRVGGDLLESELLRPAASPRAMSKEKEELILFPYYYDKGELCSYSEEEFQILFPNTYQYMLKNKYNLLRRDSDTSAKWFENGRSQALKSLDQEKICVSSVLTDKVKPYFLNRDVIPYSGFYIIQKQQLDLNYAMEVLQSQHFLDYLSVRGINAKGQSLRFSVKDFENYQFR